MNYGTRHTDPFRWYSIEFLAFYVCQHIHRIFIQSLNSVDFNLYAFTFTFRSLIFGKFIQMKSNLNTLEKKVLSMWHIFSICVLWLNRLLADARGFLIHCGIYRFSTRVRVRVLVWTCKCKSNWINKLLTFFRIWVSEYVINRLPVTHVNSHKFINMDISLMNAISNIVIYSVNSKFIHYNKCIVSLTIWRANRPTKIIGEQKTSRTGWCFGRTVIWTNITWIRLNQSKNTQNVTYNLVY